MHKVVRQVRLWMSSLTLFIVIVIMPKTWQQKYTGFNSTLSAHGGHDTVFPDSQYLASRYGLTLQAYKWLTSSVDFAPNGKTILTATNGDKTAKLWEVSSGHLLRILQGHTDVVVSIAYAPDGKSVLTGSDDGTAKLWNVNSGQILATIQSQTDSVGYVAYAPDGKAVLVGKAAGAATRIFGFDRAAGTGILWDIHNQQTLLTFQGYPAAFAPDGKTILTVTDDNSAELWDASNGQLLHTLEGHTDEVSTLAYAPDGQTVLTGSRDGTAKLWDASSGQLLHTFQAQTVWVLTVAYAPDSKTIVTVSSEDGSVKLWDVSSGQLLHTLHS